MDESINRADKRALLRRLLQERLTSAKTTTYELSPGQRALWFIHKLSPRQAAYNVNVAIRFCEKVNRQALERALETLLLRHAILRTVYTEIEGRPAQRVLDKPAELQYRDCSSMDEKALKDAVEAEAYRPFNLEVEAPLRAIIFKHDSGDVFLLSIHHIATDLLSTAIILDELRTLYAKEYALSEGNKEIAKTLLLKELPYDYFDYIEACKAFSIDEKLSSYWKQQLSGRLPNLYLPTDKPRPKQPTYQGSEFKFRLDGLRPQLTRFARKYRCTVYVVLLAVYKALLYRYTGQEDLLVGSPFAGRLDERFTDCVGYFVNPVVIRTQPRGDRLFTDLLDEVRSRVLEALEHQNYPFALLVEQLQPYRLPASSPIFQASFVFDSLQGHRRELLALTTEGGRIDFGPTPARGYELGERSTQFDLSLIVVDTGEGLSASFKYSSDLFNRDTIERLAGHYKNLLEAVLVEPQRRLAELPLLSEKEFHTLVYRWNETSRDYPTDVCIHRLFEQQAEKTPDQVAVRYDDTSITYAELDRLASKLAARLYRLGARRGHPIAICLDRSIEMVAAILAVLKVGACYVPIDPQYPKQRKSLMLSDCQAEHLITCKSLLEDPPTAATPIYIDEETQEETYEGKVFPASADDICYILYTSGSTGRPKGVMVAHRALCNHMYWIVETFGINSTDKILQKTPFSFDASVWEFFAPLITGGTLVMAKPLGHQDPDYLLDIIEREKISILQVVPSQLEMLLASDRVEQMRRLRHLFCGGEALSTNLALKVKKLLPFTLLTNLYGPTEATIDSTYHTFDTSRSYGKTIPIGRPISNLRAYILDYEKRPVPIGVKGELYVAGAGVAGGYYRQEQLTAESFVCDPFFPGQKMYRTGDLARYLPDGNIEYLGRLDSQVKIRGHRLELGEIELAIAEDSSVEAVAVVDYKFGEEDHRLVAFVQAKPDFDEAILLSKLRTKLPEQMLPARFVRLNQLPLLPNGKIDRRALPKVAPTGSSNCEFTAPRTQTESILADIWREVLQVDKISVHESFFRLGGHSLLAMQVVARIRDRLNMDLPLIQLFELDTIAKLAEALESKPKVEMQKIESLQTAQAPLSYAQQRMWFFYRFDPESPAYNIPAAFRIRGHLDRPALEKALELLAENQPTLTTVFIEADGQVFQRVENRSIPFSFVDLSHSLLSEAELAEVIRREGLTPFNLQESSMRVKLLKVAAHEYLLMITLHHIVCDGWSFEILLEELDRYYRACFDNRTPEVIKPQVNYIDFTLWQRKQLDSGAFKHQAEYWRKQLHDLQVLDLPTDRPRRPSTSISGGVVKRFLSAKLKRQLQELNRQAGATLFMSLLTAFYALLYRYGCQQDIAIGTPIAGRNRYETERLIGLFVNTLVLRVQVSGSESFHELLRKVRETALAAYDNQDLPFEKLAEMLSPERSGIQSTLFQVMFAVREAPRKQRSLGELALEEVSVDYGVAKFDLTLEVEELSDGLCCRFEYNSELFDQTTLERLAVHYERLLTELCIAPSKPIAELAMLSAEEIAQLMSWSTEETVLASTGVLERFENQVKLWPDAIAIETSRGERLSYERLDRQANSIARKINEQRAGRRVAVCAERSPQLIAALLGIWKSGRSYVPIDPDYPQERINYILRNAEVDTVCLQPHLVTQLPNLRTILLESKEELEAPIKQFDGEEAYLIYTSGSTGKPKGVAVSHKALALHIDAVIRRYGLSQSDKQLFFSSPSFDVSLEQFLPALTCGACVYIRGKELWSPEDFLTNVRQARLSHVDLPTAYWHQLAEALAKTYTPLPECLKLVTCGGEAMSALHVQLWQQLVTNDKVRLLNAYGPTEAVITATVYEFIEDINIQRPVPIGRPFGKRRIYVLDKDLNLLPAGVPGELYIGGEVLAEGYVNLKEETAKSFLTNPFVPGERLYKTADRVRYRSDGNLEFLGRLDEQVKIRGFRIEPQEIEHCLIEHPKVSQVAVVLRDDNQQKKLVAYITSNEEISASELTKFLKHRLPAYMIPQIVLLKHMPVTASGKIDYKALPPIEISAKTEDKLTTPSERALAEVWKEVLKVDKVELTDNFFSIGGDSILSIQLVSKAAQKGIQITLKQIFQFQTLKDLAAVAVLMRTFEEEFVAEGEVPLLPIQKWFFQQELTQPNKYCQSILFKAREQLIAQAVRASLLRLVRHHDALRSRFYRDEGGSWHQKITPEENFYFEHHEVTELNSEDLAKRVERLYSKIDIAAGPLVAAALLSTFSHSFLALVIHHLVVDAVSWRILSEDFETAYTEELTGKGAGSLLPKTASLKEFSLRVYENAKHLSSELEYWLVQPWHLAAKLDRDGDGENLEALADEVQVKLGREATNLLLRRLPLEQSVRPMEVILAALYLALVQATGKDIIRLDLEWHGRKEIDGLNLSRTVGWFTCIYPVLLARTKAECPVTAIKEQLRRVPQNGFGYGVLRYLTEEGYKLEEIPPAEVCFNYFGRLDLESNELLYPIELFSSSGSNRRAYLIDINCWIKNDELELVYTYSQAVYNRSRIERLAESTIEQLRALIYESLGLETADDTLAEVNREKPTSLLKSRPEILEATPILPTQAEMLKHFAPPVYLLQIRWEIVGKLNSKAFYQAWYKVLAKAQMLQTMFTTVGGVGLRLVSAVKEPRWREYDLTAADDPVGTILSLSEEDKRDFDLEQLPLCRFSLFKLAEDRQELSWTFPHLLMDGWSTSIVLAEVCRVYESIVNKQLPPPLRMKLPHELFSFYRNRACDETFWAEELRGHDEAFDLRGNAVGGSGYGSLIESFSKEETEVLEHLAKSHKTTLGIIVQAAWALTLAAYSNRDQVIFGLTFSGRTPTIAGIESMVGLLINTLPVHIRLNINASLESIFEQIRDKQSKLVQHEHSFIAPATFSSVLRFQNYPKYFLLQAKDSSLKLREIDCSDIWHYPFSLSITPGKELLLWVTYSRGSFEDRCVRKILDLFKKILKISSSNSKMTVSALLEQLRVP
ncbi:MAG: amino acid adenylation domain-containing protein [Acidobacteriota bacterium]|nr:amino acid adenylation domain-containing protein [Blastocatellia bacterium]MDW8412842.1 amino acid adenylation domain-containing protein [Acidobacteriota bacterium]